ncbi:AI-2E family transporter [bacterium]|nr:AI-2E family transporter [bacterium]
MSASSVELSDTIDDQSIDWKMLTFNAPEPLEAPAPTPTAAQHTPIPAATSPALVILATLAVGYTLAAAGAVLFPVTLAMLLALTLRPVVRVAERRRIPPLVTSLGLLMFMLIATVMSVTILIEPAQTWLSEAPQRLKVVGEKLSGLRDGLNEVYVVSEQLESLANGTGLEKKSETLSVWDRILHVLTPENSNSATIRKDPADPSQPVTVEVRQPRLVANLAALNSAGNVLGSFLITVVLGFFLLIEGDTLLTNTIHIMPRFSDKVNAIRLVHKLEAGISRYLLTITLINIGLGVVVALAMWLLGVPNALLWGLMATLLNFIPFLGALVGVVVLFLVAVFSFDSLAYASLIPVVFLTITTIEGNFITPMMVGRTVSVNSVSVLLSLVLWGWLWGLGGALIGVPLLIIFKLVCDQFERTAPIGELLAGR